MTKSSIWVSTHALESRAGNELWKFKLTIFGSCEVYFRSSSV